MELEVNEITGRRFEAAMELFREGRELRFGGIGFWMAPDGALECRVPSSWPAEDVTTATAREDWARGQQTLQHLLDHSNAFAAAVAGRPVQFVLVHDAGTSSVELCRMRDGVIAWPAGRPPPAPEA